MDSVPFSELILILYLFSLTVLLVYSSHGFIMLFYDSRIKRNEYKTIPLDNSQSVTIQLPLFNEMNVAERLINAVCEIDYPKENLQIQVLDDSIDETVEIVAKLVSIKCSEGFNIEHVKRANRQGYKAGALKEGLNSASGNFIAIFDADFIPRKDFLKKTLPHFFSSKIGMVQTRWEHLNETNSLLTRIEAFALNGHFVIEQEVRNKSGFFINFNGTGGIWRKACILDSGNWQADTLTEDLDLSYRAQLNGWKFVYLKDETTPSELPTEISSLKTQQFRWTKGAIETAKKTLTNIWKSRLNIKTKLQSTFHLTNNVVYPFVLLAGILNLPILFIQSSGEYNATFNFMLVFALAFISTFLFYLSAQKKIYKDWIKRILIFPLFISVTMGMSINNTRAVFQGLLNKKSEFVRTPKYSSIVDIKNQRQYRSASKFSIQLFFEILFTLYSLVGLLLSVYFFEVMAFPFHLMFFVGFLYVSSQSLKEVFQKK
jgi:cellulose synthase/poly-beta-1,6-N-acetylglucosamine synthase-like glycosyltransferase